MDHKKGELDKEVIYETRHHASGVLATDLSQQEGSSWSISRLRHHLSVQGVNQLKQKWSEYRRPRRFKRKMALFVSPYGEHVAVAVGNQIVILQKDDNYLEPCGIYISNDRLSLFTNGAWMEPQGILGVINDMSSLYLIDSNGGEITKRTRSELKLTAPIIDLIVLEDDHSKKSSMSVLGIFTADGVIHSIEVTKEPRTCICSISTSNNPFKERSPNNISCLDFHPVLSLAVLVDAFNVSEDPKFLSGFYCLYLLRMVANSGLELVFCSPQFEGLFSSTNGNLISVTSPKVSISPHGKYIATLDLTGCLDIFSIGSDKSSLSMLCFAEGLHSNVSDNVIQGRKNKFKDIVDICWWTDHVLVLANSSGSLIMYDFLSDVTILKDGPHICMPVLEKINHSQGLVFVLEGKSFGGGESEPKQIVSKTSSNRNQPDDAKLHWSLLSICSKSVSEMYGILIGNQQYHAALDFADRHGLNRDEVYKAQWLSSCYGTQDVDLFLSKISDHIFVLSECVDKVGPTEDAVKSLLNYGIHVTEDYLLSDLNSEESCLVWDFRMARLQLLQYKDKLDTFIGINMGRFMSKEYSDFRVVPVTEAAITLAESGKIGALNLLFKRHPYSLSPDILNVLSAIPETVPVQSYGQLLPGRNPPSTIALRERDWAEDERMVLFIDKIPGGSEKRIRVSTENIMQLSIGFVWPSITELVDWYINRAKDIDILSGQIENCLNLVDLACHKGILELQHFLEDIRCLHQLVYADGWPEDFIMGLHTWEQLSDYEKFKMLLKGVTEESAVEILQEKAIPFMQNRNHSEQINFMGQMNNAIDFMHHEQSGSFLVRWMKELAAGNKLDICLKVIENGCGESTISGLFKDEMEMIETSLECIYSCTLTNQWHVMASILSKLPCRSLREKTLKNTNPKHGSVGSGTPRFSYIRTHLSKSMRQSGPLNLQEEDSGLQSSGGFDQVDVTDNNLEKRMQIAEGHVEVGRLLAYYQVPKPIGFFLGADSDEKSVKQLLRLILSKFGRRQPCRSDSDWAIMWHDVQCFQEKAFPFLDSEYMLIEFCRGLLKAGKFSLARNYLKGIGTTALATEKAEILVVQAAREYFFSASSLSCSEIWKARECLSLFPNSRVVQSEADVIEALTVRLPNLGVTLLPVQFRQISNPLEIINMVISSQTGAYLNVEELIEVAKLLGLKSPDDIATVEEVIAREAAVSGDLQLASDLCLVLAEKDHGSIWDLCAAIARGPHIDNMDTGSRKKLLGFALSHCDEESIGELLHTWKDVDILMHNEQLMLSTETCPVNFSFQGSKITSFPINSLQDIVNLRDTSEPVNNDFKEDGVNIQVHFDTLKSILSGIAECSTEGGINWDSLLKENKKVLLFAALELQWLLQLISKEEYCKKDIPGAKAPPGKHSFSIKFRALINVLHWLAENDIAPRDELLISLAKSIMVSPATEEDDVLGCALLLNLLDAFHGVEVIEEELKQRGMYQEIHSIMNMGMSYSSIQNSNKECSSPDQRRELLLHKFREKHAPFCSDEVDQIDKVHSTFWREWKTKLEDQRRIADQARALEEAVPGVDAERFLSGDIEYIRGVVFSLIDSVKTNKKHILQEAVKLANIYGLQRLEVLLRFFGCVLISEQWENDDILTEISEYRDEIVKCPKDVIEMISTLVFPELNGHNKQRLSYVYSILSACHLRWSKMEETGLPPSQSLQVHKHVEPFRFYKVLEQECQRVCSIKELNFKNIARLDELNYDNFNEEILNNTHESTVEVLADMVHTLIGMCSDANEKGLISWQDVYKHHVLSMLASLESRTRECFNDKTLEELQVLFREVDLNYGLSKKYIIALPEVDRLHIMKRYQQLSVPCIASWSRVDDPGWKHCLTMVLDFWIKLVEDIHVTECNETSYEKPDLLKEESMPRFLKIFKRLVMEDQISSSVGWLTIMNYTDQDDGCALAENPSFFKSMIVSGCMFSSVAAVYYEAHLTSASSNADANQKNLLDLYASLIEIVLPSVSHYNSAERQNLHRLLSSLSKMEGNHVEDLKAIRSEVWRKLSEFSDNLQLESSIKVYALELMQCITGQNLRSLPDELISEVVPWEDWDESCQSKTVATVQGSDGSSNITTTLVALKSNQLIAAILPNIMVAPEDLFTEHSAVTRFLNLCEAVTSPADVDVLEAVLEEWEMLFSSTTVKEEAADSPKIQSEGNNDDWDEGWETFPDDELIDVGGKEKKSPSVGPLHACWMEIVKMLIRHSRTSSVLELLDRTSLKPDGLLLDEDEAKSLFHIVVEKDCYMALKFLLLLPYDAPRVQCLQAIESKLKESGVPNKSKVMDEYELLILVLSSGIMQSIIIDPSLGNFFSYMCYMVGYLAKTCQEDLLKCKGCKPDGTHRDRSLLFGRLLLPCFIAELVQAKQCILAGVIVSQWMHTHPSLGLIDIVEASLRKYLECQLLRASDSSNGEIQVCSSLHCNLSRLRGKANSLLQSALNSFTK